MPAVLKQNNYGKSEVRLVKVTRHPDRHELIDLSVDIALEGEFEAAHVDGDNTGLLATDTMRNTVYALAKQGPVDEIESFALRLVEHFVAIGPSVTRARVHIVEHPWARLEVGGRPHEHAFQRGSGGRRVTTVVGDGRRVETEAGIDDLLVLKTTGSGWEGYLHERYTSLPETSDRIMATIVTARWSYRKADLDYRRGLARRSPGDSRELRRPLQPVGPVHPLPDGRGRARGPSRDRPDPLLAAQQTSPVVRPGPLRARERERDLLPHQRALRADRGHHRARAAGSPVRQVVK